MTLLYSKADVVFAGVSDPTEILLGAKLSAGPDYSLTVCLCLWFLKSFCSDIDEVQLTEIAVVCNFPASSARQPGYLSQPLFSLSQSKPGYKAEAGTRHECCRISCKISCS